MYLLLIISVYLHCHAFYVDGSLDDVTGDFFGGESGDILGAFGDFNADKLTDIFVISQEGKQVDVLLTEEKAKSFKRIVLIHKNETSDDLITSVMPGDFNGDVQMDLLITRQAPDNWDGSVTVFVYYGSNGQTVGEPHKVAEMRDQPLLMDWNGDMLPDLLGETPSYPPERSVWLAMTQKDNKPVFFHRITINGTTDKFAKPHSHSFLDVNHDRIADLVIVTEKEENMVQYEVWLSTLGTLTYTSTIPTPLDTSKPDSPPYKVIGQATFADLDMDSTVELFLPVCRTLDCTDSVILVYPDVLKSDSKEWHVMMDNFKGGQLEWGFVPPHDVQDESHIKQLFPITLRVADVNMNGYPDVLTTLRDNQDDPQQKAFVLSNDECNSRSSCDHYSRTFTIQGESTLLDQDGVVQTAAFDLYEDGVLDIIVTVATEEANITRLMAFKNDLRADACFLKITVVSGICGSSCPGGRKPYGVNQPGPAVTYKTKRTDGNKQESCASQLTQSAHYALQLPYVVFGLGQTPNFVETVTVGIQRPPNQSKRERAWTQLIPNSQLIVIPYPNDNPDKWALKLFVTPSDLVYITGAILVGTCGFIAGIVGILHWREKREDKKEKMQDAQKFHFDAM